VVVVLLVVLVMVTVLVVVIVVVLVRVVVVLFKVVVVLIKIDVVLVKVVVVLAKVVVVFVTIVVLVAIVAILVMVLDVDVAILVGIVVALSVIIVLIFVVVLPMLFVGIPLIVVIRLNVVFVTFVLVSVVVFMGITVLVTKVIIVVVFAESIVGDEMAVVFITESFVFSIVVFAIVILLVDVSVAVVVFGVFGVVGGAGQVAVYSTAESWAFLHSPNVVKQVFFLFFTVLDSFRALHAVISDFIATASAQQLHPPLLHSDTFFSNSVIKVAQDPVRVVLRVMSLQLVEIELLQPARVVPVEEARETDLLLVDPEEHDGLARSPPTISVRIRASFRNTVLLEFFFLTMLASVSALFSCLLKLYTWL